MEQKPQLLETERMTYRLIDQTYLDTVFSNSDPEAQMRLLGVTDPKAFERERFRYQGGLSTHNKTFLYFHLIEKSSGKTMGWCGYHTWYLDHNRAEIGYQLFDDAFKQKGYMKEALAAILDYGFEHMHLHRIEAMIGPFNVPSLKLVRHFGFQEEGHLREHYLRDGIYEDSLVFSLLRSERSSIN